MICSFDCEVDCSHTNVVPGQLKHSRHPLVRGILLQMEDSVESCSQLKCSKNLPNLK